MAAPTIVNAAAPAIADLGGNNRATWGFAPTAGNVLVLFWSRRIGGNPSAVTAGWTLRASMAGGTFGPDGGGVFTKTAAGGETIMETAWANGDSSKTRAYIVELANATEATVAAAIGGGTSAVPSAGPITPPAGKGVIVFLWSVMYVDGSDPIWTPGGGCAEQAQVNVGAGFHPHAELEFRRDTPSIGSYTPSVTCSFNDQWTAAAIGISEAVATAAPFMTGPGGSVW